MDDDDSVSRAVAELVGLLVDDEAAPDTIARIADLGRASVPAAGACTVALWDGSGPAALASTDPALCEAEERQYAAGDGPGAHAVRSAAAVDAPDLDGDARWPGFAAAALGRGYRSVLVTPLLVEQAPIGTFAVYGLAPDAFAGRVPWLVRDLARLAAVAIANARLYADARSAAAELSGGASDRYAVEIAKGIVLTERHCSADEALQWLRQRSGDRDMSLAGLAAEVVAARSAKDA
jgi:GAF domain-containing protein